MFFLLLWKSNDQELVSIANDRYQLLLNPKGTMIMNSFYHKLSIRSLGSILEDLDKYLVSNPDLDKFEIESTKTEIREIWETIHEKSDQ